MNIYPLRSLRLDFKGEPVAKARARITKNGHAYTPRKTEAAERAIRLQTHQQIGSGFALFTGPLRMRAGFVLSRPKKSKRVYPDVRPDLDNLLKLVKDALNRIVWNDDGGVCEVFTWKRYCIDGEEPGTHIEISQIEVKPQS